jgi:L-histidine Nalpha-methyltransferase / hercynylcysteine S-oxide synthase
VDILLRAFEDSKKTIEYFALDLSLSELHRTLAAVPPGTYQYVKCAGLHGTYDDGLAWLKRTKNSAKAICVLSLGSSIGNFSRDDAADFLLQFSKVLGPRDSLLIGIDSCQDAQQVFQAYNDSRGVTQSFYRNGLIHANRLLGQKAFKPSEWAAVGRYDRQLQCHEAYYSALVDVEVDDIYIPKGSEVHFEVAYKYSREQLTHLWYSSGLLHQHAFSNQKADYSKSSSPKHAWCCCPFGYCYRIKRQQEVDNQSPRRGFASGFGVTSTKLIRRKPRDNAKAMPARMTLCYC